MRRIIPCLVTISLRPPVSNVMERVHEENRKDEPGFRNDYSPDKRKAVSLLGKI